MRRPLLSLVCATATLVSCIDADFARQSLVQTDRVLAVFVDPPVAGLDARPQLSALVVQADGSPLRHTPDGEVRFSWVACLVPESVPGLGGMQYQSEGMKQGCGGAPGLPLVTREDGSAVLPDGLLRQLVTDDSLVQVAELLGLPTDLLREALRRTGVIVTVELRVEREGLDGMVAFKRLVLVDRMQAEVRGSNPPPPRWSMRARGQDVGEARWISARSGADPLACAWEGPALQVTAGGLYVLDPVNVPDESEGEADWRESYEVIDIAGRFSTLSERAYYAWFSTAGRLDQEQTLPPADEELWSAPSEPGRVPLWVVVRDGHAGTSACRIEVDVTAP